MDKLSVDREDARAWLKSVAHHHLSKTSRKYDFSVYDGLPNHNSTLGFQFDLQPQEGKVVDGNDDWLLLKVGRKNRFFVCAKALLEFVPDIGDTALITPYARKRFDGKRLDAPVEETITRGFVAQVYKLGERVSKLPIEKDNIRSAYLRDMIEQVEKLPSRDGIRTLGQVLIDAGAYEEPVLFTDPSDADLFKTPPMLQFRINTEKHKGLLNITYDRGIDYYVVQLTDDSGNNILKEVKNVCWEDLPSLIVNLVDDGKWRIAKVEVLKPRKKSARNAA